MDNFSITLEDFKKYIKKYESFVRLNPRLAAEMEAIMRWSSYLIASRKSPIIGELLLSGANLLQLCNDILLRQANTELKLNLESQATQLKTFLSVIQSLELFAEIYAREIYGPIGRWAIIAVIQITKSAIRLVLLLIYNEGISRSQAIVPLDRIHYTEIVKLQQQFNNVPLENLFDEAVPSTSQQDVSKSVVLKSSGRRMRSIKDSKGSRFGDLALNKDPSNSISLIQKRKLVLLLNRYKVHKSATLNEKQIYGEILHITRPVAHLAMMGVFGPQSWISYITSMAMDVSSLYLVRPTKNELNVELMDSDRQIAYQFNLNERMELGQRASSLLLYLLRSPFFDQYTKERALEGLSTVAGSVPLVGGVLATFVNYIPEWQKDYFRLWS